MMVTLKDMRMPLMIMTRIIMNMLILMKILKVVVLEVPLLKEVPPIQDHPLLWKLLLVNK